MMVQREMKITEGVWNYHVSYDDEPHKSLCGAAVMGTNMQLNQWGMPFGEHFPQRPTWCVVCEKEWKSKAVIVPEETILRAQVETQKKKIAALEAAIFLTAYDKCGFEFGFFGMTEQEEPAFFLNINDIFVKAAVCLEVPWGDLPALAEEVRQKGWEAVVSYAQGRLKLESVDAMQKDIVKVGRETL